MILQRSRVLAYDSVKRLRELMTLPDLEQIFAQLVHQEDTTDRVRNILRVVAQ
jgi:hypothetical protein